jgi:hypothetical protein
MTFDEANKCFDEFIIGRWPKWKPNEMELTDWLLSLQKYSESIVKQGLFRYVQENELYNKPKLPVLLGIIGTIIKEKRRKDAKPYHQQELPKPVFWVIREYDGWMCPVFAKRSGELYSAEERREMAERYVKRFSGGIHGNLISLASTDLYEDRKYPNRRYPVAVTELDDDIPF